MSDREAERRAGRSALRAWFRPRRGAYPWRVPHPDPYAVLVSEVMLQQTQASRVAPAFEAFLRRFPDVAALAAAPVGEVLRAWAGLGYNRRAVRLREAARAIARDHDGRVPADLPSLERLAGVGAYTAAAVASIAYGEPVAAVDTNLRRIVARTALGVEPDEVPAAVVQREASAALDRRDPGAWNQAMMDLGREVCRPLRPACSACPLRPSCAFASAARRGRASAPRQSRFEGSFRQVRGAVVRVLRDRSTATLAALTRETGAPAARVAAAVTALASEGLVEASPAALAGRPRGTVRLPS